MSASHCAQCSQHSQSLNPRGIGQHQNLAGRAALSCPWSQSILHAQHDSHQDPGKLAYGSSMHAGWCGAYADTWMGPSHPYTIAGAAGTRGRRAHSQHAVHGSVSMVTKSTYPTSSNASGLHIHSYSGFANHKLCFFSQQIF